MGLGMDKLLRWWVGGLLLVVSSLWGQNLVVHNNTENSYHLRIGDCLGQVFAPDTFEVPHGSHTFALSQLPLGETMHCLFFHRDSNLIDGFTPVKAGLAEDCEVVVDANDRVTTTCITPREIAADSAGQPDATSPQPDPVHTATDSAASDNAAAGGQPTTSDGAESSTPQVGTANTASDSATLDNAVAGGQIATSDDKASPAKHELAAQKSRPQLSVTHAAARAISGSVEDPEQTQPKPGTDVQPIVSAHVSQHQPVYRSHHRRVAD